MFHDSVCDCFEGHDVAVEPALPEPDYMPEPRIYRIIRFRQTGRNRTLRKNVTLTEAQNHCQKPTTRGKGWFDGYDYMSGCRPRDND